MPPELFEDLRQEEPSVGRVAVIEKTITASLPRVRPLPSNGVMIAGCALLFVLLAIVGASMVGFPGFHKLSRLQLVIEYSAVLASAVLLSSALVAQMIPGSRLRVPPVMAVLVCLAVLGMIAPLLFPDFTTSEYVRLGMPCLRLGTLCAAGSGVVAWGFLRIGFVTDPLPAALSAAGISGLLGVAVLALHCPVLNAAHILVWHLGVILVALLGGALAGFAVSR